MSEVEHMSVLPGSSLNRKSTLVTMECKQLVKGQGRSIGVVAIIVMLTVTVLASSALSRSADSVDHPIETRSKSYDKEPEQPLWKEIKLPSTLRPKTYDIFIHPNFKKNSFTGKVMMLLDVHEETDRIIMHAKSLNITSLRIRVQNSGKLKNVQFAKLLEQPKLEQLQILLPYMVQSGSTLDVRIEYSATLQSGSYGFNMRSFKDPQGNTRYFATTQFDPVGARRAFPCFDEPAFKATFSLRVVRDKEYISLFNMPKKSTISHETDENLVVDKFKMSKKMSTFMVAFVVCDFKHTTKTTKSGTKVRVYAPEHLLGQTDFVLDVAVRTLEYYEKFFAISYPLPKLDIAAIPGSAYEVGSMESWGLLTFAFNYLAYHPKTSDVSQKQDVAVVVAHELAHQWFGNLVTMKWWNDLWLNEGFANYAEYMGTGQATNLKMNQQTIAKMISTLSSDSYKTAYPILREIKDPNDIDKAFESFTYDKGSFVIRMLRGFLGDKQFQKGLQNYLSKYKYSNAESDDLWSVLSTEEINVKTVMDTWIQSKGYPVVHVSSKSDGTATFTQKRFLFDNGSSKQKHSLKSTADDNHKWVIPFWYTTYDKNGAHSEHFTWMSSTSVTVKIPANTLFVKGNSRTQGFYRVDYDTEKWKLLAQQLMTNHEVFEAADRAGIMGDILALTRSGDVSIEQALEMTKYMEHEDDYAVWNSVLREFAYIYDLNDPEIKIIKNYTVKIMKNIIKTIGWEPQNNVQKSHLQREVLMAGIVHGHTETTKEALKQFNDWKTSGQMIAPNIRTAVYTAGIIHGSQDSWDSVWKKYQQSADHNEKARLLQSLCATKSKSSIEKILQYSLDKSKIRTYDAPLVVEYMSGNPSAQNLTWTFVKSNWDIIMKKYKGSPSAITRIVKYSTKNFSTKEMLKGVIDFYRSHKAGAGQRQVKENIQRIKTNTKWMLKHKKKALTWIEDATKIETF